MRYKVIYDKGHRLRLRSGRYAFTEKEGYGLVDLILKNENVDKVFSSHINGSLLIELKTDDEEFKTNNKEFKTVNEEFKTNNHTINHTTNLNDFYNKIKDDLLSFIRELSQEDIYELEKTTDANYLKKIENDFFLQLSEKIIGRVLFDIFVPIPLKNIVTVIKSGSYILDGLRSLNNWKIDVPVLDAAAIAGSIYEGSYDSASSLMFLLSISDILEEYTIKRSKTSLKNSLALNIDTVWKVTGSKEQAVPLSEIKVDDMVKIRMGSMIPVDGTIVDGEGMINESSMTGEPLPIHKQVGTTVYGGTILEEGSIIVSVTGVDKQTRINKIIQLIEESESLKANIQNKAEEFADSIVPYSFLATALVYLFSRDTTKALSVLLVDYSCAIKLATPISVISAMEEGSKNKILIKGGRYLENFALADTIVFDKTGTLTKSSPRLSKVISVGKYSEDEILKISACLEEHFAHSVANAIVEAATERGILHKEDHAEVEYIVAHGISTSYKGKKTMIGSGHFIFEDEKIPLSNKNKKIIKENTESYSTIFLSIGGKLEGILCIEDPVRGEAKEVIEKLKDLGIENVIMLTGDSENSAKAVSEELGISQYQYEVLPEDKAFIIEKLKSEGKKVIMVGDGINDSPALSTANVSVSFKNASDIAREVADITLLSNDLNDLVKIRELSTGLLKKIENNYTSIVGINSALIALGVFGIISNSNSSLLHNLSTVAIGTISTRSILNEEKGAKEI
ncbi:MAG: heavy metal translocating P-type ATPase [Methanobrevibacter sp.]|jgi:heavy metal translocating P-type ATPase|nr:heavy metal translocating P-type ATPase [Methanobrevibacter sp.]